MSGSNCKSDKWGRLYSGGPEAGDGEPVDEVELAGVEHVLVAERTQSTLRAGGGMGERIGSWGSSASREKKLESGMSSRPEPNGS